MAEPLPARLNPFRVQKLDALSFRYLHGSHFEIMKQLQRHAMRGEISGPAGSGKTLLLEELLAALRDRGAHTALITLKHGEFRNNLHALFPALLTLPRGTILGLDGAEQTGAVLWPLIKLITLRLRGLIVTTHHSGKLPPLYACSTTPALLKELAEELLGQQNSIPGKDILRLFALHNGNIRAALLHCYDNPGFFTMTKQMQ